MSGSDLEALRQELQTVKADNERMRRTLLDIERVNDRQVTPETLCIERQHEIG